MNAVPLSPFDLSLAAVLVLALAGLSLALRLQLEWRILIAAARTGVQLALVGLVLKFLFSHATPLMLVAIAAVMLLAAGREVRARQKRRFKGVFGYSLGTGAMLLSSFTVTIYALTVVIGPAPWYNPQYAIPLLGMMMGNSMNSVSLGVDQLTRDAWTGRNVIEQKLALGWSFPEAIRDIRAECVRTGMIPAINAMAAAGLVHLPGMMTGQILAGNPPLEAVKYQIMIMIMVAANSGFGTFFAVWWGARRLTDDRQRLCLERLAGG